MSPLLWCSGTGLRCRLHPTSCSAQDRLPEQVNSRVSARRILWSRLTDLLGPNPEQGYDNIRAGAGPLAAQDVAAGFKGKELDVHDKEMIMLAVQEAIQGRAGGIPPPPPEVLPAGRALPPDEQQVLFD